MELNCIWPKSHFKKKSQLLTTVFSGLLAWTLWHCLFPTQNMGSNQINQNESCPSIMGQWRAITNILREYRSKTKGNMVRTEIKSCWPWWCWPVIPEFGMLMQEDSLGFMMRYCLKASRCSCLYQAFQKQLKLYILKKKSSCMLPGTNWDVF